MWNQALLVVFYFTRVVFAQLSCSDSNVLCFPNDNNQTFQSIIDSVTETSPYDTILLSGDIHVPIVVPTTRYGIHIGSLSSQKRGTAENPITIQPHPDMTTDVLIYNAGSLADRVFVFDEEGWQVTGTKTSRIKFFVQDLDSSVGTFHCVVWFVKGFTKLESVDFDIRLSEGDPLRIIDINTRPITPGDAPVTIRDLRARGTDSLRDYTFVHNQMPEGSTDVSELKVLSDEGLDEHCYTGYTIEGFCSECTVHHNDFSRCARGVKLRNHWSSNRNNLTLYANKFASLYVGIEITAPGIVTIRENEFIDCFYPVIWDGETLFFENNTVSFTYLCFRDFSLYFRLLHSEVLELNLDRSVIVQNNVFITPCEECGFIRFRGESFLHIDIVNNIFDKGSLIDPPLIHVNLNEVTADAIEVSGSFQNNLFLGGSNKIFTFDADTDLGLSHTPYKNFKIFNNLFILSDEEAKVFRTFSKPTGIPITSDVQTYCVEGCEFKSNYFSHEFSLFELNTDNGNEFELDNNEIVADIALNNFILMEDLSGIRFDISPTFDIVGNERKKLGMYITPGPYEVFGCGKYGYLAEDDDKCTCTLNWGGETCEECVRNFDINASCEACPAGSVSVSNNCFQVAVLVGVLSAIVVPSIICVLFVLLCVVIVIAVKIKKRKQDGGGFRESIDSIEMMTDGDPNAPKIRLDISMFEIEKKDIKLLKRIGQGGSSQTVVYKAEWNKMIVGYKQFTTKDFSGETNNPELVRSFEEEIKIMGSISHPHTDEISENGDLRHYFEGKKFKFKVREKLEYLLGIGKAIVYLHQRKVIHRDLKPENILVDKANVPKIIDFGLSRIITQKGKSQKTRRVGTSCYMAPEIVLSGDYDYKIDIFSYSIIAWNLMFNSFDPYQIDKTVIDGSIELRVANSGLRPNIEKKGVKVWVVELIQQMWHQEPSERPEMSDIVETIEQNM